MMQWMNLMRIGEENAVRWEIRQGGLPEYQRVSTLDEHYNHMRIITQFLTFNDI